MRKMILILLILGISGTSAWAQNRTTFNLYPLYSQIGGKLIVETTGPITFSISPGYLQNERVIEIKVTLNGQAIAGLKTPPYVCTFYVNSGGVNKLQAIILYEDVNTKKIRKEICIGEIILKGAGDRVPTVVSTPSSVQAEQPKKNKKLATRLALIVGGGVLYYIGYHKEQSIDEAKNTIPDYYGGDWWDRDFVGDKTSAYLLQGLGGGLILYGIFGDF